MTLSPSDAAPAQVAGLFEEHRGFLWSISYRLTGNAADADDIVQETFVRALARPPADRERPWRPWLVQVCINLSRDQLRRRRHRGYDGSWLPSPVAAEPPSHEPIDVGGDPSARYDLVESVSFAFLLALEVLTPMQRAALLLRDVFDYSVRETADALGISEANAKTTHGRARRAMAAYEAARRPPTPRRYWRARAALERFLACVAVGDVAAVEAMLADDACVTSDAGGEFHANRVPVRGRRKVAAFFIGIAVGGRDLVRSEFRSLNGLPGCVGESRQRPGFASKWVVLADVDEEGRLSEIYTVLASLKLTAI